MYSDYEDSSNKYYDHLIQIAVVGNAGVGKTALVKRFLGQTLPTSDDKSYKPTILWCHVTTLKVDGMVIKLRIFDTAGMEEYKPDPFHISTQYRHTQVALIVFDVTCKSSFQAIGQWHQELEKYCCGSLLAKILVGNKIDLKRDFPEGHGTLKHDGEEWAKTLGFSQYLETSAKCNIHVMELLTTLVKMALAAKKTRLLEIRLRDELCKSLARAQNKKKNHKNSTSLKNIFKQCFKS